MIVARKEFIHEVAEVFDGYQPNEQVLAQLGTIDLTTVSAPAGMGKDALITQSGIPRVLADTIREPRANNGVMEQDGVEYAFRGSELGVVLSDVQRGEYVQIGMGPGRNSFYGSRIANYPLSGPVLMDLMTSQIETMRALPFRSVEPVFVVAPSYDAWIQRLENRGTFRPEEWQKRQMEAVYSLNDALNDERYAFVLNKDLSIASAALARFATTREINHEMSVRARNAAYSILLRLID